MICNFVLTLHSDLGLEWAKIDLLQLLATERSTEPVSDFIGAGEQMSDRVSTQLATRSILTLMCPAGTFEMGD